MSKLSFFILFLSFSLVMAIPAMAKEKKKKSNSASTTTATPKTKKEQLALEALFIDAVQANLLSNKQDAINKFNEVIKKDPNNHAAYFQLAKIYYEINAIPQSIAMAQNAVRIQPNNEYYYVYLAEAYGDAKQFTEASKVYENLIKIKPKEYDYYYDWAYMLTQGKLYKEAITALNTLEQKTGISEELILLKQPMWIQLNKIEEAVADMEKLVQLYPNEEQYYLAIAEIYEANNQIEKAFQAYERLNKAMPNNAASLIGMAEIYRKKGDNAKYQSILKEVFSSSKIDIDKKILTLIPLMQKMERDTTLNQSILDMVSLIYQNHPNDIKAVAAKADVLYNLDRKQEALEEYTKAITISPDSVPGTIWVQTYILCAELQEYDKLIAISEMGIKAVPTDAFAYFYNSLAHQQKKQYQQAYNSISKGLQQTNDKINNTYNHQLKLQMLIALGDVSYELDSHATSDSAYEAALEIDPNNATALNNYAFYLSERNTQLEKAERMSKKSNLLEDNNSAFLDTYAWIMYKMKNYKEALKWIEEALMQKDASDRAELIDHYGDILYKLGDKEAAIKQWQRAIEKGGNKVELENKIKTAK